MWAVLAILFLAQSAVPAQPSTEVITPGGPTTFDLATYRPPDACTEIPRVATEEVVVCARKADDPKSLAGQAALFEPKPFRPAWTMLGGEGGVTVEQRATLSGSAPAVMARFKLKF